MSSPQKDQLLATGHSPAGKFFLLDYDDYNTVWLCCYKRYL